MQQDESFPSVSVVVPFYNSSRTFHRAFTSVLDQTASPLEVVVVDDGSDQSEADWLRRYSASYQGPSGLRVIHLTSNRGPGAARNAGWDACLGEFVAFLDADDAWHPRKLEMQASWMSANPSAVLSGHAYEVCGRGRKIGGDPREFSADLLSMRALLVRNPLPTPSVMVRATVSLRFPDRRYSEDYALWLGVQARHGGCYVASEAFLHLFKLPYGEAGLSSNMLSMELGELRTLVDAFRMGQIGALSLAWASCWSIAKFLRRLASGTFLVSKAK